MTADDRLVSGASSEPSLHPNKSSGDIVERLREHLRVIAGHDGMVEPSWLLIQDSAAEIERLRREVEDAERRFVTHNPYAAHNEVLLARALTAESAVAAAWEEAAKIAEDTPTTVSMFLTKREADAATLTKLAIASAIRAASGGTKDA